MKYVEAVRSQQIKAARALLDWSQDDLAATSGISIATIRRLEAGYISPRNATTGVVRECLENAGIEFMEFDGVRRRQNGISVFEGVNGGRDFFDDVMHTVATNGGDVCVVSPKVDAFAKFCGLSSILELDKIVDLNSTTEVKCLLTEDTETPLSTPRFQFRTLSKNFVEPVPFCTYGQKYGIAVPNGEPFCKLVVVDSPKMAASARKHFSSLWDKTSQSAASLNKAQQAI